MGDKSSIEWTDATWNPVTGCTKVSAGCKNCYAKTLHDKRHQAYKAGANLPPQYAVPFETVLLHPERLVQPMRWRRPRRIFVDSVGDLFHEQVPFGFIAQVFDVMASEDCSHHIFQVLTKRADRLPKFLDWLGEYWPGDSPLSVNWEVLGHFGYNIHVGVSVEDQPAADLRIPHILRFPAAVRFLSCEPLLGPLQLDRHFARYEMTPDNPGKLRRCLSWVIVGGESGPGARPMHPDWARSLRDQCQAANLPFFFKQRGQWTWDYPAGLSLANREETYLDGVVFYRVGKQIAGRELDGRTWDEYPESPHA